jgi:hypothetical protein
MKEGKLCTQVPLMEFVSSATAAMDAHRRVYGVALSGIQFLANLAVVEGNQVSVCESVDV